MCGGFFWSLAAKNNEIDDHDSRKTHQCGNMIDHDMDDMDLTLVSLVCQLSEQL